MAGKKLTQGTSKAPPASVSLGQGPSRPVAFRKPVDTEDLADPSKVAPEDAYGPIVPDEPGPPHLVADERYFVSARSGGEPKSSPPVRFQGRRLAGDQSQHAAGAKQFKEAAERVEARLDLQSDTKQAFAALAVGIGAVFRSVESINSAKLQADAQQQLQRALERMDDAERKQTIAALMAYIGELQASGALESVPSGRLARVAKLIGEAVEVVSADPSTYIPLFKDREIDPQTGKRPTALEWFEQVWKPRVSAGEATGDDIRREDAHYYSTWASTLSKRGEKVGDYVPASRRKILGTPEEKAAIARQRGAERKRRYRAGVVDGERAEPGADVALFADREIDPQTGKKPTALEWFDSQWKPLVAQGRITGADLKRCDAAFYSTLTSTLSHKGQKLSDYLPAAPVGRPRVSVAADERLDRERELGRKRAKRWRENKRSPT